MKSGPYTVTVTVTSSTNTLGTPASNPITITITNPLMDFTINGPETVEVGSRIDLTLSDFQPEGADAYLISWDFEGQGSAFATLAPAAGNSDHTKYTLTGVDATDEVIVTVTAGGVTKTKKVRIDPLKLTGLTFSGADVEITVGEKKDLNRLLWLTPRAIENDSKLYKQILDSLEWHSETKATADFNKQINVNNRGVIHGFQNGTTLVTVTYNSESKDPNHLPIEATLLVKVKARDNNDRY
ncbi:hypothetical protein [Paenibacillus donghaensis]|uniref:Uncharacterized protein n=1 Tax=Paenibacillus donghaensis TaxID=414771 RepID=A0A2Z2KJT3_9BACL|nr:hypothetical protein [Paenibacillus donghaensis]ASA24465.1 hypothetical protein B9T62_29170 [Paenibacillus donghaensis]